VEERGERGDGCGEPGFESRSAGGKDAKATFEQFEKEDSPQAI